MKSNAKKKILLTGGHAATTAIAVVEEIKNRNFFKDTQIFFVGSRFAMEGSNVETLEYRVLPKIGVSFYPIFSGRLQTRFTRYTIISFLKIPIGFLHGFYILLKVRPNVVLAFGGFASFPIVFWSFVFGIPVILHEQTIAAGRATIFSSIFARKILLARKESLKYFPKEKCVLTGNPLIKEILNIKQNSKKQPTGKILFMGGSRGSVFINRLAMLIVPKLAIKYRVIHITGEKDFFEVLKFKSVLSKDIAEKYKVISSVEPFEMPKYYQDCDLVVSRAGANTVSEIVYLKKPAIFIPLSISFADEQTKNAKNAEKLGIARVISEKDATAEKILSEIFSILDNNELNIKKMANKPSLDADASKKIVDIIKKYF